MSILEKLESIVGPPLVLIILIPLALMSAVTLGYLAACLTP